MRPTQHEELLREAGFAVERDLERQSRREERRRVTRARVVRALRLVAIVAGALAFLEWLAGLTVFALEGLDSDASRILVRVGFGIGTVCLFASLVVRWMTRAEAAPEPPPAAGPRRLASRILGRVRRHTTRPREHA